MEPFGLFQFLQSLLTNTPTSAPSETVDAAEKANDTKPVEPTANEPPKQTGNRDAYLRFISDHEKRAKNTKKH